MDSTIVYVLATQLPMILYQREWLRVLWCHDFHKGRLCGVKSPNVVAALEPHKSLLGFFEAFPGLRRLVGGLVVLYTRRQVSGAQKLDTREHTHTHTHTH